MRRLFGRWRFAFLLVATPACSLLAPSDDELLSGPGTGGAAVGVGAGAGGSGATTGGSGGGGQVVFEADFDGASPLSAFEQPNDPVSVANDLARSAPGALRAHYDVAPSDWSNQKAEVEIPTSATRLEVTVWLAFASEPSAANGPPVAIPVVVGHGSCQWLFYATEGSLREQLDNSPTGTTIPVAPVEVGAWSELRLVFERDAGQITQVAAAEQVLVAAGGCGADDRLRLELGLHAHVGTVADVRIDDVVVRAL